MCHFQGAEMEGRSRQQKGHWFAAPSSYHCQAAAAPLLSKLINLMSPHAHEKFISFSCLVNLSSPLLPIQQQRPSNHTISYEGEQESILGPARKLRVGTPELPPCFATSPTTSSQANHLLVLLSQLLHIIPAFTNVKLKLSRAVLLAAWWVCLAPV